MAEYEYNGKIYKSKRMYHNAMVYSNLNEEGVQLSVDLVGEAFKKLSERYPDKTDKQINSIIHLGFKDSITGTISYTIGEALSKIPNKGRVYLSAFTFVTGGAIREQANEVVRIKHLNNEVAVKAKGKLEDEPDDNNISVESDGVVDHHAPRTIISSDIHSKDVL